MSVLLSGWRVMLAAMLTLAWATEINAAEREDIHGPFGPQGPRMREQLWLLPSGTAGLAQRATVFRPEDDAPATDGGSVSRARPLVVINHGTSEATRHSVSLPVYYWLSRWFVERGYVVVLPQRRGHGATGGELVEGRDSCARPDHFNAGQHAADDITAAIDYMAGQSFIAPDSTIVVGISTGGWGSLATASRNHPHVRAVVNFAGGRGGHAFGRPGQVCDSRQLVSAAARFGKLSAVPTLWFYSTNDSYFGPELARSMAQSFSQAGGIAELHLLPAYGSDGHSLADDQAGWGLWGRQLAQFLGGVSDDARVASQRTGLARVPISLSTSDKNGPRP